MKKLHFIGILAVFLVRRVFFQNTLFDRGAEGILGMDDGSTPCNALRESLG